MALGREAGNNSYVDLGTGPRRKSENLPADSQVSARKRLKSFFSVVRLRVVECPTIANLLPAFLLSCEFPSGFLKTSPPGEVEIVELQKSR